MRPLLYCILIVLLSPLATAQVYPARPIRYIVPFPAGGTPDIIGRLVAQRLSRSWGQQVVVDNRAGAGSLIGAEIAVRANPDGHTLFQCNNATNAIAAAMYKKLSFDTLKDFSPISRIGSTASALIVHPAVPIQSIADLINHAKNNPGKLNYGTGGAGTGPHLAMELFKLMSKIDIVHIAYKGSAPALADLIGGHIPASMSNVPALVAPVLSGKIRALAVTGAKRSTQLPLVPTMIESGLIGYDVTSWFGVCAPAKTSDNILNFIHHDLTAVLNTADVQQRLNDIIIDVSPTSRAEFADFIRFETARWIKVVKDARIQQY